MTDAAHTDNPLLTDLTDAQRLAVTTTEGPLLVVASAGSGKTRVITRRVAYLVKQTGIAPWQILAITFTNKAAGEMRDRISNLVTPKQARALTLCTFHALCARILREFADRAGIKPDFSIYDTDDQKSAMRQALKDEEINEKNFTPAAILSAISSAKNELIDEETYSTQTGDFFARIVGRCYKRYQQILRTNNALDFDDLLTQTAYLLRRDEQTRAELQDRYQYLLIDEYQDTNHAQFVIANQIAAHHRNICVVGDPDQSIYGWRGANIRNILEFEQHYPGAQVVELGRNYRSTPQILLAADTLIRNNKKRRNKPLFTQNPDGPNVRLIATADEEHEAQTVIDWLRDHRQAGFIWSDMVIFYRINSLSRVLEDALMRSAIPYQIVRGTAFYQRAEIRDAIAYLRVLNNPDDAVALLRIINQPSRAIGSSTIEHLRNYAAAKNISLWQAVELAASVPALNPRAVTAVKKFADMYRTWFEKLRSADQTALGFIPGVRDLAEMVIRDSALQDHYLKEDPDGEKSANLDEFITAASRFDAEYGEEDAPPLPVREAGDGSSSPIDIDDADSHITHHTSHITHSSLPRKLFDYLESIALVADIDSMKTADASGGGGGEGLVTLMTLHAAKGLEFPIVSIVGLEEGLLPHSRSFDQPNELEEERRLFFVGITRAMRQLQLSHARYRTVRGLRERAIPSQFLRELPDSVLDKQDLAGPTPFDDFQTDNDQVSNLKSQISNSGSHSSSDHQITKSPNHQMLPPGALVRHPQFGTGTILSISGSGPSARAKVNFPRIGVKTLILEYARLEIVDNHE